MLIPKAQLPCQKMTLRQSLGRGSAAVDASRLKPTRKDANADVAAGTMAKKLNAAMKTTS